MFDATPLAESMLTQPQLDTDILINKTLIFIPENKFDDSTQRALDSPNRVIWNAMTLMWRHRNGNLVRYHRQLSNMDSDQRSFTDKH